MAIQLLGESIVDATVVRFVGFSTIYQTLLTICCPISWQSKKAARSNLTEQAHTTCDIPNRANGRSSPLVQTYNAFLSSARTVSGTIAKANGAISYHTVGRPYGVNRCKG